MLNKLPVARLLFCVLATSAVLGQVCAIVSLSALSQTSIMVWAFLALIIQLIVLGVFTSHVEKLISEPITRLTDAADHLGPDLRPRELPEYGSKEISQAILAFRNMQERLARCTAERVEVLAAISHDLQTPITRMRLRAESLESRQDSARLLQDLDTMHALVKEGVTYARTLHGTTEPPSRIDLRALLESIISDYEDAGHIVILDSRIAEPVMTLPNALRRILINLVDNALKFGSAVCICACRRSSGPVISVLDNGPGIRPDQLENVFKPFYRGPPRDQKSVAGSGLGLAIARQLAIAMNADLRLENRNEGGLEARLSLSHASVVHGLGGVSRVVDENGAEGLCRGRAAVATVRDCGHAAGAVGLSLSTRR
ncbi:HAMP domain-containing sensor histidine kinase [Paraburkholderia ginsengisoli]|uniref:histidine kinase n=1 Tax=Paraburkholderia ginsengisoli TaxID=311231 RepID=A0A7T4N5L8_9BURK|nr:HAMP domain-containing sensor histidine kinase [Paraburkholderia ginsengisoli]QQC65701.1 HAMP domain-containing histidine kinase [Paraburkholderia ginsengisoli]